MSPAESAYLERHGPAAYASAARKVAVCMALDDLPCSGDARCDEVRRCRRHRLSVEVAERLERLRARRSR